MSGTKKTTAPLSGAQNSKWFTRANLRLWSGLVLFAFVLFHLLNHALGLVTIDAMETMRSWRIAVTRSLPGTSILLLAALVHTFLGFEKVFTRRLADISTRGVIQVLFGLLIPLLLSRHIIGTRVAHELYGFEDNYAYALWAMWPAEAWRQALLIALVWVHSCIGLYMWLRFTRGFSVWRWPLVVGSALIPVLAFAGFAQAGRHFEAPLPAGLPLPGEQYAHLLQLIDWAFYAAVGALALLVCAKALQWLASERKPKVQVTYNSDKARPLPAGLTLLEMSRLAKVPHASICGGRARCSTCRVQVLQGAEHLGPPSPAETKVLGYVGINSDDVRLACQVRPQQDIWVIPLVQHTNAARAASLDRYATGVEHDVTLMFIDIRGFTKFSEGRLPYDVVFVLNQYLARMSKAITDNGGYVDKFMGDGIMAMFGMEAERAPSARAALKAAADISAAVEELNTLHQQSLPAPMRIGIGIHTGECILGRIGTSPDHDAGDRITALGDTVNTASRLEGQSKELGVEAVVSRAALEAAGVDVSALSFHTLEIRGRKNLIEALATGRATELEGLLRALTHA